ncbi:Ppx/GppA phosphatase family protein [Bacteriovorax sp. DB6_IX]|uniref:Ppx/GppA phosphatase family protein n=1 Tax=Bacteriovorax sp. DB6_IX TaxID=1353530 RepID=UPI00038A3D98|nr:Ppx/GppA phosphatase domain protein [Bacteriovorax sp. DB6_IX]EQC52293.1 Ppx/GppA phosphatase domain protein [Bacteriovorax sp. DB6_IX]
MSTGNLLELTRSRTQIVFFALTFLLWGCAGLSGNSNQGAEKVSQACLVKRAALDIGSGTSKLVVASVNKCQRTIDHTIFEAHRAIPFKDALQRSKDNKFNSAIQEKAYRSLVELALMAKSQGAKEIRAVATSAFRTAANAQEAKNFLEKRLGFPIRIITQKDEALFAYNSALSKAKKKIKTATKSNRPVVVWDIGGGSMQIVQPQKGHDPKIYLGKLASVSFKNKILEKYKSKKRSPNPLGKKLAVNSMNMARDYANKTAKPMLGSLKDYEVLGVGGVHYFSIRGQLQKQTYNQNNILKTLLQRAKLTDKEIGSKYAATDVTNLALVLGFMQALSIQKVTPMKINMAHGVLTTEELW